MLFFYGDIPTQDGTNDDGPLRRTVEEKKTRSKRQHDTKKRAKEIHYNVGDKVLVRFSDKETFDSEYYTITKLKGSSVEVKRHTDKRCFTRDKSLVKHYRQKSSVSEPVPEPITNPPTRPQRNRKPKQKMNL